MRRSSERGKQLNGQEIVSIVALVIAILSAGITAYEQYFRGPRMSVLLGGRCWLVYGADVGGPFGHNLGISIEFALINDGARNAPIVDFYCKVSRVDGSWEDSLKWAARITYEDTGDPTHFRASFKIQSFGPTVMIAPSRTATAEGLFFVGTKRADLVEGEYSLQVGAAVGKKRSDFQSRLSHFTLSATAADFLRDQAVGDASTGRAPAQLPVDLYS